MTIDGFAAAPDGPNVLGAGKSLFAPDTGLRAMRLLEAKRDESGVILLRYAPEGAPGS